MIWATFVMAIREVRRNALRSFLTMLGIIIGVGSVIALVTIGEGATAKVKSDISSLGNNLLIVSPGAMRRSFGAEAAPPFERADLTAVESEISGIEASAPTVGKSLLAVNGNTNWQTSVTGTTLAYFGIRGLTVAEGRAFTDAEEAAGKAVCVIGATVRKELFGARDPIASSIRLGTLSCEVVGVVAPKGQSSMGQDQDDVVLMPLRAVQARIQGNDDISSIYVMAREDAKTATVKADLERLFRQRRRLPGGAPDNFTVRDMQEIAAAVTGATTALTALLAAIAAVSLVVGGIGIMNIMLVSVTERTREIGIRLAIGALASEVMLQFLVESVVLSTAGGIIGMSLGLGGSWAATRALQVPFVIVPSIVVVSFVFSAVVGVLFGYLPARKAARLNPIEALRHE